MTILSNGFDLGGIDSLLRSATDAEYVELSLVKTQIAQCQTGKQTRQKNEDWDEDDGDNGHWLVRVKLAGSARDESGATRGHDWRVVIEKVSWRILGY